MVNSVKKIQKVIDNPAKLMFLLKKHKFLEYVPDKTFLKLLFKATFNKNLNLKDPVTFNEKIQWLKLNDRNPMYTMMVDKYEVRNFISNKIGSKYLVPLIGIWDKFEEIDFNTLPNQFVLKCTHDSGGLVICKNKAKLNLIEVEKKIIKSMSNNYYFEGREWPYKNVKPRIICEEYFGDESDGLIDYRFFCFNGEPRFIAVDFSITEKGHTRRNLYDLNWNLMDESISYPRELATILKKPKLLREMILLSKELSQNIPHVRIDFYNVKGCIYFGEMTFYHQSGMGKFIPQEFDKKVGEWIQLPK